MKVKFGIVSIVFLLIVFLMTQVYAIDMFLTQNSNNQTSSSEASAVDNEYDTGESYDNEDSSFTNDNTNSFDNIEKNEIDADYNNNNNNEAIETIGSSEPSVATTSTVKDKTLSTSDIINIILIALCIVLILLAVAILIRCK